MGKIRVTEYGNTKEILKYNHYVSQAIILEDSQGTTVGDKKIVKAGTILPANDATAKGVLLYDVDVTHGSNTGALVIHGFIDKDKIPAQPDSTVNLPMVQFI